MKANAERGKAVWAKENDPRVTKVGRIIRKLRIDEIPQLYNIWRGDMNLVGPRPERPEFVAELEKKIPFYQLRHLVKPGITGWAQVKYTYGSSVQDALEKLQYELYYIKRRSMILDLVIILKTIDVVVTGRGAK
jgi:lipopolysaccharide/colanic/teichoic acid biosynthesis glycosyltransferase